MSCSAKKRKVDAECRRFNKKWTAKYLFIEVGGKAVCLVCGEQIAVFKDYNLSRHYETKHAEKYKNLTDAERARTSEALLAKLQKQQGFFTKLHASRDAATKTSFLISHKVAKNNKPFSEGEFVKECLVDSAALICPDKKGAFEQVPLSRRTVTRRIEEIAGNLELQMQREVMGEMSADAVTLDLLREASETVRSSPLGVINTPMIPWCQTTLPLNIHCNIHIKLENMQRTGSFKIRGVANQFARRPKGGHFVTMSAGNYGKSFAYASKHYGSKGKVVMPETAPASRSILIQSFGVEVERAPTSSLMNVVNRCVREDNMTFLHPYDDLDLIAGHASLGMEVLEVMPEPDVVVVCCGGGGLLAGVAAAIKLSGCEKTRIYGVEPEGACTMYKSLIEKKPVGMDSKSIASGLAPPFAGTLPFELCRRYVEGVVLINDEEIKAAVSTLYRSGLVVEPSGSAAFAAIVNDKIPELEEKNVVCILSGGNVGKDELANFPD